MCYFPIISSVIIVSMHLFILDQDKTYFNDMLIHHIDDILIYYININKYIKILYIYIYIYIYI